MKVCALCGTTATDDAVTCALDGEASWTSAAPAPTVEAVEEPAAAAESPEPTEEPVRASKAPKAGKK